MSAPRATPPFAWPLPPMEAATVRALPDEPGWQYEPKWDGFRCLAWKHGADVDLQSKSGRPLARYFPDVAAAVAGLPVTQCVLDGELLIDTPEGPSFEALQLRLHPAASRVATLVAAQPACYRLFDLLMDNDGAALLDRPLAERRPLLEALHAGFGDAAGVDLSPATVDRAEAEAWTGRLGHGLDGIVAKRLEAPYASGRRDAMVKWKRARTADCVVGGFRYGSGAQAHLVASLLLGLYGPDGLLHHVGHTSGLKREERPALTARLEALVSPPGFTGSRPERSRWQTDRTEAWQPLAPELVVEVSYDTATAGRFRHGTTLLRWRPDKAPEQCTTDQLG